MEGRYVPSLLAAIGQVIERHLIDIGFLKPGDPPLVYDPHALRAAASGAGSPADGEDDEVRGTSGAPSTPLGQCPRCGAAALTHRDGCDLCFNCGYSRCS